MDELARLQQSLATVSTLRTAAQERAVEQATPQLLRRHCRGLLLPPKKKQLLDRIFALQGFMQGRELDEYVEPHSILRSPQSAPNKREFDWMIVERELM
jgi:hypothetical protein